MLKLTRRPNGWYYAAGTVDGQRVRKSLGTRDRTEAAAELDLYREKLRKGRALGAAHIRTFEEAALSYMEAEGEAKYLAPLLHRFKGRSLASIHPGDIIAAAIALYPAGSGATRNRHVITPARAVINPAAGRGWCDSIAVKAFKVQRPRRTVVGRDWIDAFLARADHDGLPHLAAAVLFMWQNGARVSETARVMSDHLDLSARLIWLARTKESAWEKRHLSLELTARIANLDKSEGRPLFGYADRHGIRNRMRAVCRRARIAYVPPHQAGRHSAVSNALADGASLADVMEGMGWKSADLVLETYAHARDAGRAIADLHDANAPKRKRR